MLFNSSYNLIVLLEIMPKYHVICAMFNSNILSTRILFIKCNDRYLNRLSTYLYTNHCSQVIKNCYIAQKFSSNSFFTRFVFGKVNLYCCIFLFNLLLVTNFQTSRSLLKCFIANFIKVRQLKMLIQIFKCFSF